MNFPASSGPWFDLTFSSPSLAARFVKKFGATYAYQAVVNPANPKMVTTNGSKEEIEAILKMLDSPGRRVYVTRTLRDLSRRSSATIKPMARDKRMDLAERLYEARKARERVPSEFLPLYDHLLNLAASSYRSGRAQQAGRELRKAKQIADRRHSAYYDPRTEGGHLHNRTGYRGHRRFGYLSARDARKYSYFEKGTEPLRGGYSVAWRPAGAGVNWFLRSPTKRVVAHGHAHDGDKAISAAKHALSNETSGYHGSHRSRGRSYKLRNERDTRHHHRSKTAPSFATQTKISRKIRLLREEGYPPKQAAAIAYRMYGASRPSKSKRRR